MPSDIGTRLRRSREGAGLSMREASKRMGWASHAPLSLIESGKRSPYVDTVERLAAIYKVPLAEVLS